MTHPYRHEIRYSWPSSHREFDRDWSTTAHGGFIADFTVPITEAYCPALAELVQRDRLDDGPVTVTSATPSA
jgi:hypothetical protein